MVMLIYLGIPLITYVAVRLSSLISPKLEILAHFLCYSIYLTIGIWLMLLQVLNANKSYYELLVPHIAIVAAISAAAAVSLILLRSRHAIRFVSLFAFFTVIYPTLLLFNAYEAGIFPITDTNDRKFAKPINNQNLIIIIYDELPLSTILDRNGLIDEVKFPNFRAFANDATWFVNAQTVSSSSEVAVAAILSGLEREPGTSATFQNYPDNLFYIFREGFDAIDLQFATDLNPVHLPDEANKSWPWKRAYLKRLLEIAWDTSIIYGHIIQIDQFGVPIPPVNTRLNRFFDQPKDHLGQADRGIRHHNKFVDALDLVTPPVFAVYHNLYPHNTWHRLPSGLDYAVSQWSSYISLIPSPRGRATLYKEKPKVLHDLQAHLFQSMHSDKLFGELISKLEEKKMYKNSLIIFVVDHGVSLWPGANPRMPTKEHWLDVYGIPLLVKLPNQTLGRVSFEDVTTLDIYPTILHSYGIEIGTALVGQSLLPAINDAEELNDVSSTPYKNCSTVKRKSRMFGAGLTLKDLYGFGRYRDYLERPISEFEIVAEPSLGINLYRPGRYEQLDLARVNTAIRMEGILTGLTKMSDPKDILVGVNGKICGGTQTADYSINQISNEFTLLIPEECFTQGENQIRFFLTNLGFFNLKEISRTTQ
jgi:hypothetical protein